MRRLFHSLFSSFHDFGQSCLSAEDKTERFPPVSDEELAYSYLSRTTCPVSSLRVTNRAEWKDIPVDEEYTVSFFLLGSRIICAIPVGVPTPKGISGLLAEREMVLEQTGLAREKHVEIRDFGGLRARPSKEARMILANQLLKDVAGGYLIGYWVAHVPFQVKWMFQVGNLLHKPSVPLAPVRTFEQAVRNAVRELAGQSIDPGPGVALPRFEILDRGRGPAFEPIDGNGGKNRSHSESECLSTAGRSYTEEMLLEYADEMIRYIGAINWDQAGIFPDGIGLDHPFREVFDALALVKSDLDDFQEQREKSRNSLQESEQRYRTIIENIEDGYFEVDLSGNLIFFNSSLCEILGYGKDEVRGINNRRYMDPETSKKVYETFKRVYTSGVPTKGFEYEIIRKDGGRRHLDISVSPVRGSEARVIGFRGIARDITQRKVVELELERYRHHLEEMVKARTQELTRINKELEQEVGERRKIEAELRAASAAKSEFLAKMSHEIRTPLNGIIGMAELCLEGSPTKQQRNLLQTIDREAKSLFGIINSVLDFSKIEAGKLQLEEISFDLRNTFEDIAQAFAYSASQKGLTLLSRFSADVPVQLLGDPGRLRQIFRNLLENAVKFTEHGSILFTGELVRESSDTVMIRFLVKDTGIGIPKEKQSAVFESFTQADNSTTRKYGGTGLGVTIAKQLAESMDGEMWLKSEVGKGSTFGFTAVFKKNRNLATGLRESEVDLQASKILVVADEGSTSRSLFHEALEFTGCTPSESGNPGDAMKMISQAHALGVPFDLVLIGLNLSLESGFELSEKIRNSEDSKALPILVLTPYGKTGDGKRCREIGINGYLTKPIGKEDLRRTINAVLASAKTHTSGPWELITRHTLAEQDRRRRILLVEDYPTNRQVAQMYLEKAGYRVDLAENGKLAVTAFKEKPYDLIFMDLQMPEMDGYQATRAIRDLEGLISNSRVNKKDTCPSRVPIVAMTAHAVKGYYEECIRAGMDDYLTKPFVGEDLLGMTEKWLNRKGKISRKTEEGKSNRIEQEETPMKDLEGSPMDFEKAVREFEGDRQAVLEVTRGFLQNAGKQVNVIRGAIETGNSDTVRKEAHSIKGGASNLAAPGLAKIAEELEELGKSGFLTPEAGELLCLLQHALERLEGFIGTQERRSREVLP